MLSTWRGASWFAIPLGLIALACWTGCGRQDGKPAVPPGNSVSAASAQPAASKTDRLVAREVWDVLYLQGARAGHSQTKISRAKRDGRDILEIDAVNRLVVKRESQRTEQEVQFKSVETPDGQLLEFQCQLRSGPVPMETVGRVDGQQLVLTTTTAGKKTASVRPWSREYAGPYGVELSLMRQPMRPGDQRRLKLLLPASSDLAEATLTAVKYEPVALRTGTYELLRIDTRTQLAPGIILPGTLWTDRTGDVLKTYSDVMSLSSYRATKAEALDEKEVGEIDLTASLSVPLAQPLALGHRSHRIRWRVQIADGDPAAVFTSGPSQQVKSIDAHTAEITVVGLRPASGNPPAKVDPPTADDREPNNMIQSDDPAIVAMAKAAAGDEKDPWKTAVRLERFVHDTITKKGFSQAFATAAEVAQTREGDCTEHAVLLAALARARGLPARVAIGLVYVAQGKLLAYHMWNEIYIGDRWIPMDGTLAQGGIGGAHLKLADSALKGASAYSSFLPVLQVTGRLKAEVMEEE